jgi:DNA gyrase subunit B
MDENKNKEYGAHSIKIMEGLEAVRKRPGMYIGSTDTRGLHHLVYEVVDNSVDEALAGYCKNIHVTITKSGSCIVKDDGRGIPVDIHPVENISAAEVVLTKLHAGGKFDKETYAFSGGLHGVGVSVVNALSEYLKVTIYKKGKVYQQEYQYGNPLYSLKVIGNCDENQSGTEIEFKPDTLIFLQTVDFSFDILQKRFKEMAFLNKGISIILEDERVSQVLTYSYPKGIVSYIEDLMKNKQVLFPDIICFSLKERLLEIEMAMQYSMDYSEELFSFVNTINTHEGGTHVAGFRGALTSACNKKAKEFKYDEQFTSDDLREGLICVLSVKIADPQFEGQTKAKLSNFEIKGIIQSHLSDFFNLYFEENPSIIKKMLAKAELAQKAREAAKRARELTRKKNGIDSSVLCGKLADCSSNEPENNELFIVEGNSAGGSAKMGRDRMIQAILPLRGKILNVEKTTLEKMLANSEIKSLVAAVGAGFGNDGINVADCRYHKIIIMTDADIDGAHIRTLLLTFFFRFMRPIIEAGYLYIAQPPLYKVKVGRKERYLKNDDELFSLLNAWILEEVSVFSDNKEIVAEEKSLFLEALYFFYKAFYEIAYEKAVAESTIENIFFDKEKFNTYEFIAAKLGALPFDQQLYDKMIDVIQLGKNKKFFYKQKELIDSIFFSILDLVEKIKLMAKPFMTIQRYKGLGEMNEDQLWETAMDPEKRQLKKVYTNDLVDTEGWVVLLMGEEVAPRKQFIEENALRVKNLDV